LEEIKQKEMESISIYNEFVLYFCQKKEFTEAVNLLSELVSKDIVPNEQTYQILMENYWKCGMAEEVYAIYHSSPSDQKKNILVRLFLKSDQLSAALDFLASLKDEELSIDNYLPLMQYFAKSKNDNEVNELIKEFKRMKFKINHRMMNGSE
jgi:pentatricopeptide repeat protein